MTYIIAEPCIGTKDTACVDVCPVDCIHPRKDEATFADEEAECEKRYAADERAAKERELARLQQELGVVCYAGPGKRGKLRIVACSQGQAGRNSIASPFMQ